MIPAQDHFDKLWAMKDDMIYTFMSTFIVLTVLGLSLKPVLDHLFKQRADVKGFQSSAMLYLEQAETQKYFYASYIMSMFYSIGLCIGTVRSVFACSPPEELANPGGFLGNTMFTNDYCRIHMNDT